MRMLSARVVQRFFFSLYKNTVCHYIKGGAGSLHTVMLKVVFTTGCPVFTHVVAFAADYGVRRRTTYKKVVVKEYRIFLMRLSE